MPGLLDDAMDTIRNVRGKLAPLAEKKTAAEKVDSKALLDRNAQHTETNKSAQAKAKGKMVSMKGGKR